MKYKNLAAIASILSLAAAANAQSLSSHFVNLDFDAGVVNFGGNFNGFDNPNCEIIGWKNRNDAATLADSGVEGPGAWWGPYQDKAAFMKAGDGAYNLSDYTIQAGDIFSIDFYARTWDSPAGSEWTVSLFYDTPANVIGSFTQSLTGTWTPYSSSTPIEATVASAGGKLGIMFYNSGTKFGNVDEIAVNIVPEPTTFSLAMVAGLGLLLSRRQRSE